MKEKKIGLFTKAKLLLKIVKEYKKYAIFSIILITLETAFECIIPYVMQMLITDLANYQFASNANQADILNKVIIYGVILLVLAMCSFACGVSAGRVSAKASSGFARNLREEMFNKTMSYSFSNIDDFSSSSLITRQTYDINEIQMAFMILIRVAVRAPIMFIFSFIMFLILCPELGWIFLITIPLIVIPNVIITINASKRFNKLFYKFDELNEKVEENVRGMRVVKNYSKEEYEKEKFKKESLEMANGFKIVEQMLSATNPIIQCVMYISMCLILFVGTNYIISTSQIDGGEIVFKNLTIGGVSSLITYSAQVLSSLLMVSMVSFFLIMAVPAVNRVYDCLVAIPTIKNNDHPIMELNSGDIEFKNVSFKYKESASKYALSNINLYIKEGETIGIIGSTGSSKSTLVNLISRFYDVSEGEVKVGGINVKDYDLTLLRDKVSMVLQKNILFKGSIKDNLRWGNMDASEEDIIKACKIAQADSFIEAFPDKYDYMIEQGGSNVSGGQRQRLCIARALLKNPKVLILDDSTSAVDTKTDAYIREGFKNNLKGITKIIIAQRISSVMDADRIIVMDNGCISGFGTHEELLKNNQIYKEVYILQNRIGVK